MTIHQQKDRGYQHNLGIELLDSRRMFAGLQEFTPGDANLDGVFDSSDLVAVFQAGKFETEIKADWSQGDWNDDGFFNSGDLVVAMQTGRYGVQIDPPFTVDPGGPIAWCVVAGGDSIHGGEGILVDPGGEVAWCVVAGG